MGFVRFFQKRYAESEACCLKVLSIKPDHAYALSGLGMNQARLGRLDEGIKSLRRAMEIQPGWSEPYWDLAIVLKDGRRYDDAVDTLNEGIRWCPSQRDRFERLKAHIEGLRGR